MRSATIAAGIAIVIAMAFIILAGGRAVQPPAGDMVIAPEDLPADFDGPPEPEGGEPSTSAIAPPQAASPPGLSRTIDPEVVAPPSLGEEPLQRADPRPPLSELALAQPPKPKMPDEWKGTTLFQPVATAAGLIQAKGYTVAVSGIDVVAPEETCIDPAGKRWNCGVSARTAFRAFLRGRAVVCTVPPEGGRDTISAACRIGKQDVGAWLVENGWARAAAGGPYVEEGRAAESGRKGIFGAAPDLSGLPPAPPAVAAPAEIAPSILDLSGEAATPAPPLEPVQ
jgi:endonuclease YncB( thermonuclease family)